MYDNFAHKYERDSGEALLTHNYSANKLANSTGLGQN